MHRGVAAVASPSKGSTRGRATLARLKRDVAIRLLGRKGSSSARKRPEDTVWHRQLSTPQPGAAMPAPESQSHDAHLRHIGRVTALMDRRPDLHGAYALADLFDDAARWSA